MAVAPILGCPDAATKRQMLSEATKLFDPCLPASIRSRDVFGGLWKKGLGWDEHFPGEFQTQWRSLPQEISSVNSIHFNRRVLEERQA